MTRDVNLNSSEWCELVFEGKNKNYGAYEMRQTSSKRHIVAFVCTLAFVTIIALIPTFMSAIAKNNDIALGGIDEGPYELAKLKADETKVEPEVIPELTTPPPTPIANSLQFTPPAIVDDTEVNAENEMRTQEELNTSTALITTVTHVSDTNEGADPGDLLREERNQVIGTPQAQETIFETAEQMPQFPGGNSELMRFLRDNLRYPTVAAEMGIEGRVIVKFVVGKTGKISDVQVLKGIDPSCDKEAARVVNAMPSWVPGMQNGHQVAVYFTLPVLFKLQR